MQAQNRAQRRGTWPPARYERVEIPDQEYRTSDAKLGEANTRAKPCSDVCATKGAHSIYPHYRPSPANLCPRLSASVRSASPAPRLYSPQEGTPPMEGMPTCSLSSPQPFRGRHRRLRFASSVRACRRTPGPAPATTTPLTLHASPASPPLPAHEERSGVRTVAQIGTPSLAYPRVSQKRGTYWCRSQLARHVKPGANWCMSCRLLPPLPAMRTRSSQQPAKAELSWARSSRLDSPPFTG
jgi:hypothetical protein